MKLAAAWQAHRSLAVSSVTEKDFAAKDTTMDSLDTSIHSGRGDCTERGTQTLSYFCLLWHERGAVRRLETHAVA